MTPMQKNTSAPAAGSVHLSEEDLETVCALIGAPGFVQPWLDRFYERGELRLLLILAGGPLTTEAVKTRLTEPGGGPVEAFLDRAYRRAVVSLTPDGQWEAAPFHARYEIWALFEGWLDLPADVRRMVNEWEYADYAERHRDHVAALKAETLPDPSVVRPRYLLLNEAKQALEKAEHIYLWPCNCRAMMNSCQKPVYTCLRFDNNRGIGWEISKARAYQIIREANKAGLMQSGELGIDGNGKLKGAICNCCPDCCFPHQLADREDAKGLWPQSRYIARFLEERCAACGLCVRRCPFQAFRIEERDGDDGKTVKTVFFSPDRCRGCGLCSVTCPGLAIKMDPLPGVDDRGF